MRIVVNDIAASTGGALTVLKEFYNCVKGNDKENEWIFLLSDKFFEETENVKIISLPQIKKSGVKKVLFDFFTGKKLIKKLNPDVVFSLQNIITFGLKIPQAVYVHQSIPFQNIKKFSFFKKNERSIAIKQFLVGSIIKASIKRADKVIVQTEWMKEAVCRQCGISEAKIVNIMPNVKDISTLNIRADFEKNRFFYPTSQAIYKNNQAVFDACNILDSKGLEYSVKLTLDCEQSKGSVECIGRVPYEQVVRGYKSSTLIFPSYIETFGYPLAEARALGAIVLASDCPFSRELLEGYKNAYFFDPFKPQELACLMEKVIKGEIVKQDTGESSIALKDSWLEVINYVKNPRVLFLTNVPSPYRVDFFKQLGKSCDLTVLFEKGSSDERDESWKRYSFEGFKGIVLKGKSTDKDKAFSKEVLKYLKDFKHGNIIIANAATPTGMLAIEYLRFKGIPYYIEGDGGFAKSGKGLKEKVKRHFLKGAKGYFSTSAEHDNYYLTYGAKRERIYRYPFTSLKTEDIIERLPTKQEKAVLRKKMGITEEKVVIAVGQFIHRKGFDVLIDACRFLDQDTGVYIVGGRPDEEYIRLKEASEFKNIHFMDFMLKPQLIEYFKASDLFVLPTREDIWGLVINEAMACGLPVITTDRCIAGLELIEEGKNGFIVPVEESALLAEKIKVILAGDELRREMGQSSLEKIREYTFEKMSKSHLTILK